MSLLNDIQSEVVEENSDLGPILLKLRLLAARVGSQSLAEWVRYESEGYPGNVDLPDYRRIPVNYLADFSGRHGFSIKNAAIPPSLIEQLAGKEWVRYEMRESISIVDDLMSSDDDRKQLGINAAELIKLLHGKVYQNCWCNSVNGIVSRSSLANVRHAVRSRVLEITLEFEKLVPDASAITIGAANRPSASSAAVATQITNHIVYGHAISIANTGDSAQIQINVVPNDKQSLIRMLTASGMYLYDAEELAEIAASETPDRTDEPIGPKVREWLVSNLSKAASGAWEIGISVATDLIKESLLKFYGMK